MTTDKNQDKKAEEIARLDELFAKRYTDEDEEYQEMKNANYNPPVVPDWSDRQQQQRFPQYRNRNNHNRFTNDRYQPRGYHRSQQYQHRHHSDDRSAARQDSNYHRHDRPRSRSPPRHYHRQERR